MTIRRNKPNTFIVGAPKCGTTALANYLNQHKNVFFSALKEPHYFSNSDMPGYSYGMSIDEYLDLFDSAKRDHSVIAEGSVWYLKGPTALSQIYNFDPAAKIIVMLRRPDEMLYSMHNTNLGVYAEDIKSFELAWFTSLKGERQWDKKNKFCRDPSTLDYASIAKFGTQIERLLEIFPKNQVKIIFFEDFKTRTESVFRSVENFLTLKNDNNIHFQVINESSINKWDWIGKFVHRPPQWLVKPVVLARSKIGLGELGIINRLNKVNTIPNKLPALPEHVTDSIITHHHTEIEKLSSITNRDLSSWLETN